MTEPISNPPHELLTHQYFDDDTVRSILNRLDLDQLHRTALYAEPRLKLGKIVAVELCPGDSTSYRLIIAGQFEFFCADEYMRQHMSLDGSMIYTARHRALVTRLNMEQLPQQSMALVDFRPPIDHVEQYLSGPFAGSMTGTHTAVVIAAFIHMLAELGVTP